MNLRDSVLILVILHLKLDGPNLNNLEFEGLCRSEAFRLAPVLSHASILMFPGMSMKSFYRPVIDQEAKILISDWLKQKLSSSLNVMMAWCQRRQLKL